MTALEVLSEARDRGLSLSVRGDGLVACPNRLLTPDFKGKLCEFKPALLPLLQTKGITWIEVHSERLGEALFSAGTRTPKLHSLKLAQNRGAFTPALNCKSSWRKTASNLSRMPS